jgi:hypothetical protein
MPRVRARVVVAGTVLGAAAGAAALLLASTFFSRFRIDFTEATRVHGVYPAEYVAGETFSWIGREAAIDLPGLDRRLTWSCTVPVRGAREDVAALPTVSAMVDGVTRATLPTTNEYQPLTFAIPPRSQSGAVLILASSNTFQPGPADRRALGVRIQSWTCRPERSGLIVPPQTALMAAASADALFGAAFGLIGCPLSAIALGVGLLAAGQGAVIVQGMGAFAPYVGRIPVLAFCLCLGLVLTRWLLERRRDKRLPDAGRFVLVYTAGVLFLKLLALLHPSQPMGDALFHAHRLERVRAGNFFFTQPLASGVEFPYAIGLYLFAAPWSMLTHDHVMLLRIVVSTCEAAAGALLYLMVVRIWANPLVGAAAVVLISLVPMSFAVNQYGLLANGFGQSLALATVAGAAVWPLRRGDAAQWLGLTLVSTLALLSHVSTFAILLTTLLGAAALFWLIGGQDLKQSSKMILTASLMAAALSVTFYYGHFGNVYLKALQARAEHRAVVPASQPPARPVTVPSFPARAAGALRVTAAAIGWPILALAAIGAWRLWREAGRDRLVLVIESWGLAYAAFTLLGIASPVDAANQRYAAEFVGRVAYASSPAAALLAARGGVWAWRQNLLARAAVVALGFAALMLGVTAWLGWLRS